MSSVFGKNIKISVFGESHGRAIGVVIDGLPSGFDIDTEYISREMGRRKPSAGVYSTRRNEADEVEILSGIYKGKTTGTPVGAIIRNNDSLSRDYDDLENLLRPGHADFSGLIRYKGYNDKRGSGHFSGRLTAPVVFAGAIAAQILSEYDIVIGSHIDSIYDTHDIRFDSTQITREQLNMLRSMDIPVNDRSCREAYLEIIDEARKNLDSVGGIVETAIIGVSAGIGSPLFDNIEAKLSSILFSIPAVKGVEFGEGFGITRLYGSQANDSFYLQNENIYTKTNNNGGINGGITNGMPIVFRTAIKPTSSIAKEQVTVDIKEERNAKLKVKGRHDTCIVPRAVPVIDAAAAIAILDILFDHYGLEGFNKGR
ncbi:MAG: chorismate synthase [Clostridiaceae bacterium]|jgi:chorismate synthase|nr:chorismate synthase [Clostridiaceae bacterium]